MAALASIATGNFTAAGTWALCDPTVYLDSVANNTALTTSYVASAALTPGAITVDGFAVKIAARTGTTGTMSVELYNSTDVASVATVTINCSDINAGDTATNGGCGWYMFSITPTLLIAGKAYQIRAKTSSATQVTLFRNSTAGNWSRLLRTTTTQAPAAGDLLYIQGQWTAAATSTSYTVTMDETATTAYGTIAVSNKSTLAYGVASSTNYYLKSQTIDVYDGGTFNQGTTGSNMPSTSTAVLEFNSASAAQYGLNIRSGGVWTVQGNPITSVKTLLTANISASGTSVTVGNTTGWAANDELCFAGTTGTTQNEKKTITTVNSSTNVTIAAITNAHSGTSPTQGEVGNLTRNVKIRGISAANTGFIKIWGVSSIDIDYGEFSSLGNGGTAGVTVVSTSGSVSCRYSSFHDSAIASTNAFDVQSTAFGVEFSDNVGYNFGSSLILISVASSVASTINNNLAIQSAAAPLINCLDVGATVTNNTVVPGPSSFGISMNETASVLGTFTGNTVHNGAGTGISFSGLTGTCTADSCVVWRLVGSGITFSPTLSSLVNFTLSNSTFFGNQNSGLSLTAGTNGLLTVSSCTFNAGTSTTQPIGVSFSGSNGAFDRILFKNCNFGVTTTHATADINVSSGSITNGLIQFYNCNFASTNEISGQANLTDQTGRFRGIISYSHDNVEGSNKAWNRYGTNSSDTTIFNTLSPSFRQTPNNASFKLYGTFKQVPVTAGKTVTVSIYVRKSVVGDGAAYNGNQPRIILRENLELGINSDTVIATATDAANGAWIQLTGTTSAASTNGAFEFYLDCDGTAGWVNWDNFTSTPTINSSDFKYSLYGLPLLNMGDNSPLIGTFPYKRRRFGNLKNSNN